MLGEWPMAMKQPCRAMSSVWPSCVLLRRMPVTPDWSPSTSSSVKWVLSSILPVLTFSCSLSTRMGSALNLSRRWTRVTLLAILNRYRASSTAVLPPPTTQTGCSR
ncbi:hypothetical protein D3C78_1399560 [compost metagenome]